MKLINVILAVFYLVLSSVVGLVLLGIFFDYVTYPEAFTWLSSIYNSAEIRLSTGLASILLIFINLCVLIRWGLNAFRKRRVVFNKPQGKVSISLAAIEDFIRRSTADIEGLRDLKARVKASGRNLSVFSRVVLSSDINLLEITNKLQAQIKSKIQNLVGVDNVAKVEVHISRIIKKGLKEQDKEVQIPYQGIDYGDGT